MSYLDIDKPITLEHFLCFLSVSGILQMLRMVKDLRHVVDCALWLFCLEIGKITFPSSAAWTRVILTYKSEHASFRVVYLEG